MTDIKIGGVIPFTTIDFPNHISCVFFLQGCPWNCVYCHNPHLLDMQKEGEVSWEDAKAFLKTRENLLDGVVFSGGEPLAQKQIKSAIEEVKAMGFYVAVHTNGYNPDALADVLPLLTWVGLDVKAPFAKYGENVCSGANGNKVEESLKILAGSGIPYEVRTTLDPRVVSKEDVLEIVKKLNECGVINYAMQQFRPNEGDENSPSAADISQFFTDEEFLNKIKELAPNLIIREG